MDSSYKKVLLDFGFYQDYRALTLEKSYRFPAANPSDLTIHIEV
jgi:hypothetical protein